MNKNKNNDTYGALLLNMRLDKDVNGVFIGEDIFVKQISVKGIGKRLAIIAKKSLPIMRENLPVKKFDPDPVLMKFLKEKDWI